MIWVIMRRGLPSGTVTFLFTDVEGSTKLLEEIGDEAYDKALVEHRRVVRAASVAHGGVEVDTQGDAFFFAFPSAPGALAAAFDMTKALAPGPIHVRIGLHTGKPRVSDEGYVGREVHLAARLAGTGHGGQIVLSKATAELVDASVRDLGEHRLKDIQDPVSIYQLGDGHFPPLKTISNTNLPRPASSFVGREHELSELLARIEQCARLVTLTGPGGSGKTRLALEAAATLVTAYKAGVFWVGLASLRDSPLVIGTIAQTLGAKDGLADHIGEREMLLLLDNLEQVIEAAPELSALLASCPNLTLLVTSRELLRVQGEVEYPVPPLAEAEAVSLFCERAQSAASGEIAELCRRLDNLPLAVELAAARTKALSPTQILERLSQRLDLLKGGRDADPRQQTLRATIEWSYDLLSREEQQLFARLSVFAGGWTFEAADEVADAELDTLQSLVEKTLVRYSNERYWMLETIREYAAEQLDASEKIGDLPRRRHAEHFLQLAEAAEPGLLGSEDIATLRLLESERDNFRQALIALRELPASTEMLRLAAALARFWYIRGPLAEGRAWLREALSLASGSTTLRAKALFGLAMLLDSLGEYTESEDVGEASVQLYRELGDEPEGLADALNHLANVLANLGMDKRSEAVHEETLARSKDLGSPYRIGRSLANLSALSLTMHNYERAADLAEEALPYMRDVGDSFVRSVVLANWGCAVWRLGQPDDAIPLLRESLSLARDLGSVELSAGILTAITALVATEDSLRSATLLGCVDALCEGSAIALPRFERELLDTTARELTGLLGADSLLAARTEGRRLEFDDSVEYGLRSLDRMTSRASCFQPPLATDGTPELPEPADAPRGLT